jgi:hypothetical protein
MTTRRDFLKSSTLATAGILAADPLLHSLLASPLLPANEASLRFRQVHLDYHTSGLIEDIATRFDPEEFASTLKKAYVNSVTCFGRCHHGYIYHDTKKFPERHHPFLKRNLLKEQIEACHKQNIRVPVYVTVQWDHFTAQQHPEWLMRNEDGAPEAFGDTNVFHPGFYNHLCIHTPYRDFLKSYLTDLFESVPVDGLFLDIHHVRPNANRECIEGMLKKGLDPSIETVRYEYYQQVMHEYKTDLTAFIRKLDKTCTIFYNGGHIGPHVRPSIAANTHLELESLPSGGWGYLHFPLTSRYARNLGLDSMGMTGKFHTSWGDFHSLKNRAALEFETSMMLAMNAKCSIGDQLHPRGKLDTATYDLIGFAYKQVAEKEAWCEGAKAMVDIALFSAEEFIQQRTPDMMLGAIKLLQEGSQQFDIVDSKSDFSKYKVLILPDLIVLNDTLRDKISKYLAGGGALIASHRSGLTPKGNEFALADWGVGYIGEAPYNPDFIVPKGKLGTGLPSTEFVMYLKGLQVKANAGSEVLADVNIPYFNREWDHFVSHKHTPSSGKVGYPGIVKSGRVIYFAHPVFEQYARNAPVWCKKLVLNALDMINPEPLVKHTGPSSVITALNEQPLKKRAVLHLLHYVPERRGTEFDTIEDVFPIYNTGVSVKTSGKPKSIKAVPNDKTVSFEYKNNRVDFVVAEIKGHQMVEINF